jgi:hypothetical protein
VERRRRDEESTAMEKRAPRRRAASTLGFTAQVRSLEEDVSAIEIPEAASTARTRSARSRPFTAGGRREEYAEKVLSVFEI